MQNPGAAFEARRQADVNTVTHRVALDLQNYALQSLGTMATASSEFSTDWPAAGAIDGDRTHINAGSGSTAENDLGRSVWRGAQVSGGGGVLPVEESLTVDFGQDRKINRLTLIFWPKDTKNGNLGAIAPADFIIETSPVVPAFTAWADLADKSAEIGKAATTIVAGVVTGNVNDMVVFEAPAIKTARSVRIRFTKLQAVGVNTRVVEVLITRAVDITEDVNVVNINRRKDYRLNHRLASEVNLTLTNFDRKYSPSHVSTALELAAGFFNSELRPNLEVRAFQGFSGTNVQIITAFLDRIQTNANNRLVMLKARDYFKYFTGRKVSTKLKAAKSLEFLVELLANLANHPSNLIILDTTTVNVAFFFPKDADTISEMQKLADATGDAEVFMDEFGRLNFRSYLNVISHIFRLSSAADFQAGTNVNTDATSEPGVIKLATSGPNFVTEGTFTSALSFVLEGKVLFDRFESTVEIGPATAVDFFIRVTNDGGVTFTPWREAIPSTLRMSKWNHGFSQVQVRARLRTSDPTQTPKVHDITVRYKSRGGSRKVSITPDFTALYNGILLNMGQVLTDEVGGANYIVTRSIVKSKPTFLSAGPVDAWFGTVDNAAISASNPLVVPVGDTTFQVDFGDGRFNVPQTVIITLGTAVATTTLSSHPSKPFLTITATVAGTITGLKIEGVPFIEEGTVEAVQDAEQPFRDLYGPQEDVFENDYIDNTDLAADIARGIIQRFQQPLTWLPDAVVRPTPNAQLNDRVTVRELNADLDADFLVIGLQNELQTTQAQEMMAQTKMELVKLGAEGDFCEPAFFGSAGIFYYSNFKFGGCRDRSL